MCCAISSCRSSRARWSPSWARRAREIHAPCTCSAALDTIDSGESPRRRARHRGDGDEARVAFRNRHIGFVFRFITCCRSSPRSRTRRCRCDRARLRPDARPKAEALLRRVGLGERLDHRPGMMSGRRAAARGGVARAGDAADLSAGGRADRRPRRSHRRFATPAARTMHAEFGLTAISRRTPSIGRAMRPNLAA